MLYRIKQATKYDENLYTKVYEEFENLKTDNNTNLNISNTSIERIKTQSNVIGKIKIEKIGIEYPILNETTEELMKIAPTKYYGPRPNRYR